MSQASQPTVSTIADSGVVDYMSKRRRNLLSNDNTWVANDSDKDIVATTGYECFSYCGATSRFVNRLIPAKRADHDEYCQQSNVQSTAIDLTQGRRSGPSGGVIPLGCAPKIKLTLKLSTAKSVGTFTLDPDESVVVKNIPNGAGLDVFKARYGSIRAVDGAPLGQIYNN